MFDWEACEPVGVYRTPVPGGWLYKHTSSLLESTTPMTFVPDVNAAPVVVKIPDCDRPDAVLVPEAEWFGVDEKTPPEKTLLMVTGHSGYNSWKKKFLTLAYYDEKYRPRVNKFHHPRWLSVCNDSLSDQSWTPSYWAYPIALPGGGQ